MDNLESSLVNIELEFQARDPSTDEERILQDQVKLKQIEQEVEGSLGETEINKNGMICLSLLKLYSTDQSKKYLHYSKLLRTLNNIDWTFNCQQKSSPSTHYMLYGVVNAMTPVAYWFYICGQYFTKDQESLMFSQIQKLKILRHSDLDPMKKTYDYDSDVSILEYRKNQMNLDDMINKYEKELIETRFENDEQLKELGCCGHQSVLQFKEIANTEGLLRDICGLTSDELEYIDKRESFIQMQAATRYHIYLRESEELNLEYNSIKNIRKANQRMAVDDGALCQVCNDGDYQDDNLIVFCQVCISFTKQRCNVAVHQRCYLVNEIPQGDWICDVCSNFGVNGQFLRCALCPKLGGAMKSTQISVEQGLFQVSNPLYHCASMASVIKTPFDTEFQYNNSDVMHRDVSFFQDERNALLEPKPKQVWVHLSCLFWTPECYIQEKCDTLRGIENIDKKRFLLGCSICGQKKTGASVQCSRGSCQIAYHPECARRAHKLMSITTTSANRIEYQMFCDKHTPFKLKRILETKHRMYEKEIIEFFKSYEKCRIQINRQAKQKQEQKIISKKLKKSHKKSTHKTTGINQYFVPKYQFTDEEVLSFARQFKNFIELANNEQIIINLSQVNIAEYKVDNIKLPRYLRKAEYQLRLIPDFMRLKPSPQQSEILPYYKGQIQGTDEIWNHFKFKDHNLEKTYCLYQKCTRRASRFMQELNPGKAKRQSKLLELLTRKQHQHTSIEQKKEIVATLIDNEVYLKDENYYCVCRKKFIEGYPMIRIQFRSIIIECEMCDEWYHFDCLAVKSKIIQVEQIEFYCFLCESELEPKLRQRVKATYKRHFEDPSFFLQKQLARQTNLGEQRLENIKQKQIQISQPIQSSQETGDANQYQEQQTNNQDNQNNQEQQKQEGKEEIQALQDSKQKEDQGFNIELISTPLKCVRMEGEQSKSKSNTSKSLQKQSCLLDFFKKGQ